VGALAHEELPFEHLVSELGLDRDLSRTPLFQVVFVQQEAPKRDFDSIGFESTKLQLHNGSAKFDLVLEATPSSENYDLSLEFNSSIFRRETADRILRHFTNLLKHACSAPETPLSSLSLMDGTEVKELFAHVNQHAATFDNLECLHATFEERVKASPNAPALSYDGKVLT